MRRAQFELALREVGRITTEVVIIGSQCLHVVTADPPGEVVMSVECDVLLDDDDPRARRVEEELGKASTFAQEHGVYVDTVSSTFPFLPVGWESRLVTFDVGTLKARCLEVHDLVLSKLAAGRLKDYELIAALLSGGLARFEIVRERIEAVADLHMRAILLARLQIVVDSLGR
jgi:hypothetical protein